MSDPGLGRFHPAALAEARRARIVEKARVTAQQERHEKAQRAHHQKAQALADDPSFFNGPGHVVDPEATPEQRLNQMFAAHEQQLQDQHDLRDLAAKLESADEVATWWEIVLTKPSISLLYVANALPQRLRVYLPQHIQDGLEHYSEPVMYL